VDNFRFTRLDTASLGFKPPLARQPLNDIWHTFGEQQTSLVQPVSGQTTSSFMFSPLEQPFGKKY
jgi:hypothetical protein